ncbi:MAG: hypothetical protein C5S45_02660 [Candidatus Methanocomedens sp.]|nr:MAG: hypothetical protein C5S45_02660 [ANME-2 cluster archaeon]
MELPMNTVVMLSLPYPWHGWDTLVKGVPPWLLKYN